jgi:hypothetical protein
VVSTSSAWVESVRLLLDIKRHNAGRLIFKLSPQMGGCPTHKPNKEVYRKNKLKYKKEK